MRRLEPAAIGGVMSREVANFRTFWKSTMFSSVFPAMFGTFVKERFQRTYDAILAAPVDVEELVTAEMLWISLRAGVYGCFPLFVSMIFGLDPAPGMVLVPIFCFITALGFSGFGVAVAASVAKIDQFNYVTTLVITPLFLVAGTFFPIDEMPLGIRIVSQLNPLHQLVELVRDACFGFEANDLLRVAFLVGFAIALWRIAVNRMERRLID
jgi:lipooligosaccharide transport system permease protein